MCVRRLSASRCARSGGTLRSGSSEPSYVTNMIENSESRIVSIDCRSEPAVATLFEARVMPPSSCCLSAVHDEILGDFAENGRLARRCGMELCLLKDHCNEIWRFSRLSCVTVDQVEPNLNATNFWMSATDLSSGSDTWSDKRVLRRPCLRATGHSTCGTLPACSQHFDAGRRKHLVLAILVDR